MKGVKLAYFLVIRGKLNVAQNGAHRIDTVLPSRQIVLIVSLKYGPFTVPQHIKSVPKECISVV